VDAGDAPNVSAYFSHLSLREPDWATARAVAADLAAAIGGVSEDDLAWAEDTLGLRVPA